MSADSQGNGKQKMTPGTIFGFLFLGGLGLYLFMMFFAMGIEAFGEAKRRYPEVVMGVIMIGFAAGAIAMSAKSKQEEKKKEDKH